MLGHELKNYYTQGTPEQSLLPHSISMTKTLMQFQILLGKQAQNFLDLHAKQSWSFVVLLSAFSHSHILSPSLTLQGKDSSSDVRWDWEEQWYVKPQALLAVETNYSSMKTLTGMRHKTSDSRHQAYQGRYPYFLFVSGSSTLQDSNWTFALPVLGGLWWEPFILFGVIKQARFACDHRRCPLHPHGKTTEATLLTKFRQDLPALPNTCFSSLRHFWELSWEETTFPLPYANNFASSMGDMACLLWTPLPGRLTAGLRKIRQRTEFTADFSLTFSKALHTHCPRMVAAGRPSLPTPL